MPGVTALMARDWANWSDRLIGSDGVLRHYRGNLAGTPVFLGCSDIDPHVPRARVDLTAGALRLGADMTERIYPNMAHTVNQDELNQDELAFVRGMMAALTAG